MRLSSILFCASIATGAAACEHHDDNKTTATSKDGQTQPAPAPKGGVAAIDTAKIEQLTGAKGKMNDAEGVFKVSVPRSDLQVKVGGVKLTPAQGLTAWAAFHPMGDHLMVMGDIVVTEDQVTPVMDAALGNGLEVTALHNHFLGDTPKVMFMHIGGMGTADALAGAVGKVFAAMKQPGPAASTAEIDPAKSSLDAASLDAAVGAKGEYKDGVYKVTVGRTASMDGEDVAGTMGVNTWAAFAGTADQAVVDGDVAMTEAQLQPTLKALRANNIQIVAIHQHMAGETPRILFLHYWGIGKAADLAKGVRAALDVVRAP